MDWSSLDPSHLTILLSAALSHQVTQFGLAFGIAAWIHAGQVRKEIKVQMLDVVGAIDKVALVLRQDLSSQAERIGNVEQGIGRLTSRVVALEKPKGE